MHKQFYFLSPVEVVKVSSQNLQEVAEWCGGKVAETESRRVPGRMDSYVWVPTPKGSNISWAFPGMFITKRLVVTVKGELKATWSVFRRDYFEKNYFDNPKDAVDKTWELEDRSPKAKEDPTPSEPIVEPPASTLDVEEMDDETRERIEQVNADILKRNLKPVAALSQPRQADEHEAVLVQAAPPIGGTTVPAAPAEVIEAFVHDHDSTEKCDASGCTTDRFVDGIHVFNDLAFNAVDEDTVYEIPMPATVAEKKS